MWLIDHSNTECITTMLFFTAYHHKRLQQRINESANLNNGAGFLPIGTYILNTPDMAFTGSYDGQEFTISNLVISRPDSADFQGLFGCIGNASVMNLIVDNAQISGNNNTGILAGYSLFW